MRCELPPQRKWPHGVHPPGNASMVVTPTMEKLATQGNHPVEQKEVGFGANEKRGRTQLKSLTQVVPPFDLEEFLDTKSQ